MGGNSRLLVHTLSGHMVLKPWEGFLLTVQQAQEPTLYNHQNKGAENVNSCEYQIFWNKG